METLCGVTVALALVPEAVAFALSAGLTPSIGLHSAWIIALVTAIMGGRPAMICGATGSLAVLVGDTVTDPARGIPYLFCAVILMGFIEILCGVAGVGSLVILIPTPVMIGFCNGLALVIGLAQFNNYKVPPNRRNAMDGINGTEVSGRRLGSFDAFTNDVPFIGGQELLFAVIITLASFAVCMWLPKLTKKVPSALVAIVVGTIIEWTVVHGLAGISTPLVGDIAELHGGFPKIAWLDSDYTMPPLNMDTFQAALPLAITMAAVGLLESLMTLNLVDELTETPGDTMRECMGQGVANIICGTLGGMGGCAMIGQSMINVGSGARTRVSSACAGIFLLFIVLVGYMAINIIPVSALVGVMFNVVFHTFEWKSMKLMFLAVMPLSIRQSYFSSRSDQKIRRADALVILVVTVTTLFTDLARGVAAGMLVAVGTFLWDSATLLTVEAREQEVDPNTGKTSKFYDVNGILFFGSTTKFLSQFDEKADPEEIVLSFNAGYIADYSAIEALNKLGERYGTHGKRVKLQQLRASCGKIVEKSRGLLVKELDVRVLDEKVLPTEREHLNVEQFDAAEHQVNLSRQVSYDQAGSGDRFHDEDVA